MNVESGVPPWTSKSGSSVGSRALQQGLDHSAMRTLAALKDYPVTKAACSSLACCYRMGREGVLGRSKGRREASDASRVAPFACFTRVGICGVLSCEYLLADPASDRLPPVSNIREGNPNQPGILRVQT